MKYRYLTLILPILISLSLIGVGFSAWTISGLEEESFDVSITADKVINSKEYVYLDANETSTGIDCFKYYEYGYLDSNGYTSNYGNIITTYKLDLTKCRELFKTEDSVEITFKLQYNDGVQTSFNLFKYEIDGDTGLGSHDIDAYCSCDSWDNITFTKPTNNKEWSYTVSVFFNGILSDTSLKEITFSITYELFATVGAYFNKFIYPHLYKDAVTVIGFKTDVTLVGFNKNN